MAEVNFIQALNLALQKAMTEDEDVILLGQDIGKNGGIFRATEGLFARFGSTRVIDTPLAEAGIVGCAVGMALYGLKPVAELQFSGFSYQAFHQVEQHVSRYRNRTRGEYPLPMVIRMPCGGGIRAFEHHSESRESYYAHTPGLKIVMPSTPSDVYGLLRAAIRDPDPVVFLEPAKLYRGDKAAMPHEDYLVEIGKANIIRPGESLTLISYGSMIPVCIAAAEKLADQHSIEVIDLRSLVPLDMDTLSLSVKKTGRAVIVHEAPRNLGMSAEISARLMEKCFFYLKAPIERVTGYDVQMPYYQLEQHYIPNIQRVVVAIKETLEY